ncbi:MAG: condensation domain-containing protein, partial [Pseudomonadota bacterium]
MNAADAIYPLTPLQLSMLAYGLREQDPNAYQVVAELTISGDERMLERLQSRWAKLVAACPALRTNVVWEDLDEPLQVVLPSVSDRWQPLLDVRDGGEPPWHTTPIPLSAERLWRWQAARRTDDRLSLRFQFHHIILDGWSMSLLIDALLATDEGPLQKLRLAPPFEVVVERLQDPMSAATSAFWRDYLEGVEPVELPVARASSPATVKRLPFALHPSILNGLSTLATALRTTLSTLVHSAWALALMELSGNRRVSFGITGSGRSRHRPPLSAVIGPCIETVPLAPPAWDGERRLK